MMSSPERPPTEPRIYIASLGALDSLFSATLNSVGSIKSAIGCYHIAYIVTLCCITVKPSVQDTRDGVQYTLACPYMHAPAMTIKLPNKARTIVWLLQNHKPHSHDYFNSLPVAYFSIQILIHLSRWVESGFIQTLRIYATRSELKSLCARGFNCQLPKTAQTTPTLPNNIIMLPNHTHSD